jgi:molybdopterin synthase catalytic subunit
MIQLSHNTIDVAAVIESVRSPSAGAVVVFLGTARDMTEGRPTRCLEYEAFSEMARQCLAELEDQARRRWPLVECTIVHRLGEVAAGEVAVAIAASAAHRRPAFEAAEWLIGRIKEVVPIWKKENWAEGTSQWVHPGLDGDSPGRSLP